MLRLELLPEEVYREYCAIMASSHFMREEIFIKIMEIEVDTGKVWCTITGTPSELVLQRIPYLKLFFFGLDKPEVYFFMKRKLYRYQNINYGTIVNGSAFSIDKPWEKPEDHLIFFRKDVPIRKQLEKIRDYLEN